MLWICGDRHGEYDTLSYKNWPESRNMTTDDFLVILGDCGFVWNHEYTKHSNQEEYILNWLNNRGYNIICICGNHENYDVIEHMPIVDKFGGLIRQCAFEDTIYENIYYVLDPTILNLDGYKCLIIPKAESHDKQYRTEHLDWWPQEQGNINIERHIINNVSNQVFDFVFTHDCCGYMNEVYKPYGAPGRLNNTPRELFFEELRQTLDFKCWAHGHMHEDRYVYGDDAGFAICLYQSIITAEEALQMIDERKETWKIWKQKLKELNV